SDFAQECPDMTQKVPGVLFPGAAQQLVKEEADEAGPLSGTLLTLIVPQCLLGEVFIIHHLSISFAVLHIEFERIVIERAEAAETRTAANQQVVAETVIRIALQSHSQAVLTVAFIH